MWGGPLGGIFYVCLNGMLCGHRLLVHGIKGWLAIVGAGQVCRQSCRSAGIGRLFRLREVI